MRVSLLSVHGAVLHTIESLGAEVTPADAGLVRMALLYAEQIDARGDLAAALASIQRELVDMADDPGQYGSSVLLQASVDKLARSLDAHKVLADLGPRLLDVLTHLGATPKARAAIAALGRSNGGAPGPVTTGASPAAASEPVDVEDGKPPLVEDRVAAQRRLRQAAADAARHPV